MGRMNRVLSAAGRSGGGHGSHVLVRTRTATRGRPFPEFRTVISAVMGGVIKGIVSDDRRRTAAGRDGVGPRRHDGDDGHRRERPLLPRETAGGRLHAAGASGRVRRLAPRNRARGRDPGLRLPAAASPPRDAPSPRRGSSTEVTARPILAAGFALPSIDDIGSDRGRRRSSAHRHRVASAPPHAKHPEGFDEHRRAGRGRQPVCRRFDGRSHESIGRQRASDPSSPICRSRVKSTC